MIDIRCFCNPKGYATTEEVKRAKGQIASAVKLVCGVANNLAWYVCADAIDMIKRHPNYKHRTKVVLRQVLQEYKNYRYNLLSSRAFNVSAMHESVRSKYSGITNEQYLEYWETIPAELYQKTRNGEVTVLMHKYKKVFDAHNIPHSNILQYVACAQTALHHAVDSYESILNQAQSEYGIPYKELNKDFSALNMERILKVWYRLLICLEPQIKDVAITDSEQRNIDLGVIQLKQAWTNNTDIYSSAYQNIESYEDLFVNKKAHKQELKRIRKIQRETNNTLNSVNLSR